MRSVPLAHWHAARVGVPTKRLGRHAHTLLAGPPANAQGLPTQPISVHIKPYGEVGRIFKTWRLVVWGPLGWAVLPAPLAVLMPRCWCPGLPGLVAVSWCLCRRAARAPPFRIKCGSLQKQVGGWTRGVVWNGLCSMCRWPCFCSAAGVLGWLAWLPWRGVCAVGRRGPRPLGLKVEAFRHKLAAGRAGSFGTGCVPCVAGLASAMLLVCWVGWRGCRGVVSVPSGGAGPAL